jgi:hypothetical protein
MGAEGERGPRKDRQTRKCGVSKLRMHAEQHHSAVPDQLWTTAICSEDFCPPSMGTMTERRASKSRFGDFSWLGVPRCYVVKPGSDNAPKNFSTFKVGSKTSFWVQSLSPGPLFRSWPRARDGSRVLDRCASRCLRFRGGAIRERERITPPASAV